VAITNIQWLASDLENGSVPFSKRDVSGIPPEVLADARRTISKNGKKNGLETTGKVEQLVSLYQAARDKDYLVIFNPGGWGWATIEKMPLWASILKGLKETLSSLGRNVLVIDYLRTTKNTRGMIGEVMALSRISRAKGGALASQVEFLLKNLPGLKIILTGESNGAVMAEKAFSFLRDNPRVFSIQTGTPFWAPSTPSPRSLIINHNGEEPDTFSRGDAWQIIKANIGSLTGKYQGNRGNILFRVGAPGHVYNWDYPVVRQKIVQFLEEIDKTE
jgi:hypothetical protein